MAESKGMKKAKMKKRHSMERDGDRSQIREDYSAPANLPQEVIHEFYPRTEYGIEDSYLNDSLYGVDKQMNDDVRKMRQHKSKSKY